jgi:hypothetical protein
VADTYGIEWLHPYREGRSQKQIGKKRYSNHRWIVGGKLCYVLNRLGLIVGWSCAKANVYDTTFHPLIRSFDDEMLILVDHGSIPSMKTLPICSSVNGEDGMCA